MCEEECNIKSCDMDGGDCEPSCFPGCTESMIGDGLCDEACMNANCEWDKEDCKDRCTYNCLKS